MDRTQLTALQDPLKQRYRTAPEAALITLHASGALDQGALACNIDSGRRVADALAQAGLHPAAGGDGSQLCSGDMLLEALVACAGVTLAAVATAVGVELRGGEVRAEGDLDFRGTLGVDREAPVGFTAIRLAFRIDAEVTDDQIATLAKLTERYCVVYQTLRAGVPTTSTLERMHG
ncbi:MAG: OsmC family protein [Thermoleophilia bacterium]